MRRHFVIAVFLLLPSSSLAIGSLGLFSDEAGTSCLLEDHSPGTLDVYVVHTTIPGGAVAVQFAVTVASGFTGTFLSATPAPGFLYLGDPSDYAVAFGGCFIGTFLVATFQYQGYGTSESCSSLSLSPAPTSPAPGYVVSVACDCCVDILSTTPIVINYQQNCPAWCITGTEESTWGKVKALYR